MCTSSTKHGNVDHVSSMRNRRASQVLREGERKVEERENDNWDSEVRGGERLCADDRRNSSGRQRRGPRIVRPFLRSPRPISDSTMIRDWVGRVSSTVDFQPSRMTNTRQFRHSDSSNEKGNESLVSLLRRATPSRVYPFDFASLVSDGLIRVRTKGFPDDPVVFLFPRSSEDLSILPRMIGRLDRTRLSMDAGISNNE